MLQTVRTAGIPGDAARTLLDISSHSGDGSWHLQPDDPEAPDLLLQVEGGRLVDLHRPGQPSVLHRALVSGDLLKSRERDRLIKRAAEQDLCAGLLALEEGLVDGAVAGEAIGKILDDDLLLVLGSGEATWTGPSPEPIDSGLYGLVDLGNSLEDVLYSSALHHKFWEGITDLPMLREVVAATPAALSIIGDPQTGAEERMILESADGNHDVGEIAGSRPDRWRALDRLLRLIEDQHLETQSAMELFRSGEHFVERGDSDRALRRWRRAEELGLDDFDLGARIGEACGATGRTAEAARRLRSHAQRCSDQLRIEAARDAWTGVVLLDPTDSEARDRAISLWNRDPGTDPDNCIALARALLCAGEEATACQFLDSMGAHLPDPRLHSLHQEAAVACGDPHATLRACWRQAESLRASEKWQEARKLYETMAEEGEDSPLLNLRLVEVALHQDDHTTAREHARRALFGSGGTPRPLDPAAREALISLSTEEATPAILHRWVAEESRAQEDGEQELIARRNQWQALLREQDPEGAREVAARCQVLAPEQVDIALQRSQLEEQLGHQPTAVAVLQEWCLRCDPQHPGNESVQKQLLRLDGCSTATLEQSLQHIDPADPRLPALKLAVQLRKILDGDIRHASPEEGAEAMVLSIVSALLGEEEATRVEALKKCADQIVRHPDPLVHLLKAGIATKFPQHPLLQRSTPPVESTTPARGEVIRSSIGGITEKLKGVQTGDSAPRGDAPAQQKAPVAGREEAQPAAGGGIQSALDRLRSMRSSSEPETTASSLPEVDETPEQPINTPPPPPSQADPGLGSAAARLGALRQSTTDN